MGLVELFCETVEEAIDSPHQWVWWSGVAMVSALMGRQVHTTIRTDDPRDWLYGNIFTLLIGRAGVGKTDAIANARYLLREAHVDMMPDDISGERLVHYARTPDKSDIPRGTTCTFLDEFDQLFHESNSQALKRVLVSFYDCRRDAYKRETFSRDQEKVEDMCLTLIGGATPAHMARTFRPQEWQEGLPSRMIYVWGDGLMREDYRRGDMKALATAVKRVQDHIFDYNQIGWSADAEATRKEWRRKSAGAGPVHPLAEGYNARRLVHASKVALILTVSRLGGKIELADWKAALAAIEATEVDFGKSLALAGGNEYRDIEESVWMLFEAQTLVPEHLLRRWVGKRVGPHLVEMVINEMEAQRRIICTTGTKPNRIFKLGETDTAEKRRSKFKVHRGGKT